MRIRAALLLLSAMSLGGCGQPPEALFTSISCTRVGEAGGDDLFEIVASASYRGPDSASVSLGLEPCGDPSAYTFATECTGWTNAGGNCTRQSEVESGVLTTTIGDIRQAPGTPLICTVVLSLVEPGAPGAASLVLASAREAVNCQ